jgi:hypothetical protein
MSILQGEKMGKKPMALKNPNVIRISIKDREKSSR